MERSTDSYLHTLGRIWVREPCQVCSGILSFSIKLCGLHCSFVKFWGSLNAIHCFCVVWSQRLVFFRHNVFGPPNDLMVLLFFLVFLITHRGWHGGPSTHKNSYNFSRIRRRAAYLCIKEKKRSNYSKTIPHLGPKWGWSGENTKRAITYKNRHLRSRPVLKKIPIIILQHKYFLQSLN